jgi:hypothetical protein
MKKIRFDISMRPQIESGEYQVVMRDNDKPVRIICWDADPKYPICYLEKTASQTFPTMVGPNGSFYDDPEDADEFESRADLFVLVPDDVSVGEYTGDNPGLTEHQKDLLEREVVSRIPYGLQVYCPDWTGEPLMVIGVDYSENDNTDSDDLTEGCYITLESGPDVHISMIRPYLRPLSEMTDTEWSDLDEAIIEAGGIGYNHQYNDTTLIAYIDFMLKHHFDYRGLIDMGLAIKAPKEMYG